MKLTVKITISWQFRLMYNTVPCYCQSMSKMRLLIIRLCSKINGSSQQAITDRYLETVTVLYDVNKEI